MVRGALRERAYAYAYGKLPVLAMSSATRAAAVIEGIRAAQERGLQQGRRFLPPYATALAEIAAGRKETHWIWYIWPSLAAVRPNVQLPQYLLPDLATARLYLEQDDLRARLLEISVAATEHLQAGVRPEQLFGRQHKYDVPKFHETMTAFAVAGRLCAKPDVEAACLAGIAALTRGGGLHRPTVQILVGGGVGSGSADEVAAVQALAAVHGVSPPPQTGGPSLPRKQKPHKQTLSKQNQNAPGSVLPQQPSPLSSDETQAWDALQAQAAALKKRPKRKGKPTPEQREADASAVRGFREARRAFLAGLSDAKRAWLDAQHESGNGTDGRQQNKQRKHGPSEAAQRLALREFAIRPTAVAGDAADRTGAGAEAEALGLIDIGANLQGRYSSVAISRQLERAACAGVETIILTGCDLVGSKKGAEVCEAWLLQQQARCSGGGGATSAGGAAGAVELDPGAASLAKCPVQLWTTSGCHPHDAQKIARFVEVDEEKECVLTETGGGGAGGGRRAQVVVSDVALDELRRMAGGRFCVAIGECGLDYDRMFSPREIQLAVFNAQVALAAELRLPLFVHLRERDQGPPIGACKSSSNGVSFVSIQRRSSLIFFSDCAATSYRHYCRRISGRVGDSWYETNRPM